MSYNRIPGKTTEDETMKKKSTLKSIFYQLMMRQKSTLNSKTIYIYFFIITISLLVVSTLLIKPLAYICCLIPTQSVTLTPSFASTETMTSTNATITPTPQFYQATENLNTSQSDIIGKLDVEYPASLFEDTSEMVDLNIFIPQELLNVSPATITRIPLPSNAPLLIESIQPFHANIYLAGTMRVELTSLSFEVSNLFPSEQRVDILRSDNPTYWAWIIRAPHEPGIQIFTVKVFLNQDTVATWLGNFPVSILAFTSTPEVQKQPSGTFTPLPSSTSIPPTQTLTPTPLPVIIRIKNSFIDNASQVFGSILTYIEGLVSALLVFIAALIGIYFSLKEKRKDNRGSNALIPGQKQPSKRERR